MFVSASRDNWETQGVVHGEHVPVPYVAYPLLYQSAAAQVYFVGSLNYHLILIYLFVCFSFRK